MKIKRTILIILVVLSIVLIDTVQAKIFNNRPVISIVEDYNGGDLYQKHLYQKHKGILVDTYVYSDGSQVTAFKWEKQQYVDATLKFHS